MEVAERCSHLRYLCISNCPHLTDQSLAALAHHCLDLVTLECAGLSQLTDAGFQVPTWVALKYLYLGSFQVPTWAAFSYSYLPT